MTDEQLTGLFTAGTAPERDAAFAQRVDARIASERRGLRLVALAVRALVILMLAAAVFAALRVLRPALEPMLEQIAESSPHFMGVPLPLVLGAVAVGLAVYAMRLVRLRLG